MYNLFFCVQLNVECRPHFLGSAMCACLEERSAISQRNPDHPLLQRLELHGLHLHHGHQCCQGKHGAVIACDIHVTTMQFVSLSVGLCAMPF